MILAVVLTLVFIVVESADMNRIKRNNRQSAANWCASADYRFKHHCDMKKN